MESLLPYYERELTHLRRLSHDFAKRYPKIAGRLLISGENCDDPHIERLIESFAFLAGRIHKKLDDDYPEFTDALLQVVYPQYLRPFPSVSIARFEPLPSTSNEGANAVVPRHTMLHTRPVRGVACRFRTAYEVQVSPVCVQYAAYENTFDTSGLSTRLSAETAAVIRLRLSVVRDETGSGAPLPAKLRFFLNGEPSVVAAIREAVLGHALGVWVGNDVTAAKCELSPSALLPVGFADDEYLLDVDARCHPAYQLLLEYFAYPEKFNFFDLDLSKVWPALPNTAQEIDVRIACPNHLRELYDAPLLERISKENFLLHCTPVVNLFRHHPEPIRMTETVSAYPIIVDTRQPKAYDVYAIRKVYRVSQDANGDAVAEYRPFYSIKHADAHTGPVRYWHADFAEGDADFNVSLSLVDSTLAPDSAGADTISLDLMCTNRDLPAQLPFGLREGDLFLEGGASTFHIQLTRKPTPSYRFPRGRGAQWRLISHLTLNQFSLAGSGTEALKEILTLYDITDSPTSRSQIQGIDCVQHETGVTRMAGNPFPVFVKGVDIRLTVDERHYAGTGLFSFTQVLDRFFGLYGHTNSFTRLTVVSKQSGKELLQCPARNGASVLA